MKNKEQIIDTAFAVALVLLAVAVIGMFANLFYVYGVQAAEISVRPDAQYMGYVKILLPFALVFGALALTACGFALKGKGFAWMMLAGGTLGLLILTVIARLNIPLESISTKPALVSYINLEFASNVQSSFLSLFALSFIALVLLLLKNGKNKKKAEPQAVEPAAESIAAGAETAGAKPETKTAEPEEHINV